MKKCNIGIRWLAFLLTLLFLFTVCGTAVFAAETANGSVGGTPAVNTQAGNTSSASDNNTPQKTAEIALLLGERTEIMGIGENIPIHAEALDASIASYTVAQKTAAPEVSASYAQTLCDGGTYVLGNYEGQYLSLSASGGMLGVCTRPQDAAVWTVRMAEAGNGFRLEAVPKTGTAQSTNRNRTFLSYRTESRQTEDFGRLVLTVDSEGKRFDFTAIGSFVALGGDSGAALRCDAVKNDSTAFAWGFGAVNEKQSAYAYAVTETPAMTVVTLTANKIGTTAITVGDTLYTIRVSEHVQIYDPDTLTVHYRNYDADGAEFYSLRIKGAKDAVFSDAIGPVPGKKNVLEHNRVTTAEGKAEEIPCQLAELSGIDDFYKNADYTCVGAAITDEGKTLSLYYSFNPCMQFAVDFSLPIRFRLSDFREALAGSDNVSLSGADNILLSGADILDVKLSQAKYGTLSKDSRVPNTILYTPTAVFSGVDTFFVTVTYVLAPPSGVYTGTPADQRKVTHTYCVNLFPTQIFHYEENFAQYTGEWHSQKGMSTDIPVQKASPLGAAAVNPGDRYGYDGAYADTLLTGNRSYYYIDAGNANLPLPLPSMTGETGTDSRPKAEFTFCGTGVAVDFVSGVTNGQIGTASDAASFRVSITLQRKNPFGLFEPYRTYLIDTAAAAGSAGTWEAERMANTAPKFSTGDHALPYDTYRLVITPEHGVVAIDGFRVYGTLDGTAKNNLGGVSAIIAQETAECAPLPEYASLEKGLWVTQLQGNVGTASQIAAALSAEIEKMQSSDGIGNGTETANPLLGLLIRRSSMSLHTGTQTAAWSNLHRAESYENGMETGVPLSPGDALVFCVTAAEAQIGLRAERTSVQYSIYMDGERVQGTDYVKLNSGMDMYYPLFSKTADNACTHTVVIKNTSPDNSHGVLVVSKAKLFGTEGENPLTGERKKIEDGSQNTLDARIIEDALAVLGFRDDSPNAVLHIDVQCGKQRIRTTLTADKAQDAQRHRLENASGALLDENGLLRVDTAEKNNMGTQNTCYFSVSEIVSALEGMRLPAGYRIGIQEIHTVGVLYGDTKTLTLTAVPCAPGVNADNVLYNLKNRWIK
ncbi:MAG: hypothetical protein J6I50_03100 [Clostridia bacterium]|nr:hypothetical protein [Clostridia bacterium]